jgi:hypothetical protein
MRPLHPPAHDRDRLRCATTMAGAAGVLTGDGVDREVAELLVEEAVGRAAPELAVGRKLEPGAGLQRDSVVDGPVLGLGQGGAADLAGIVLGADRQERGRTQQAANMFGAKRRLHTGFP